MSQPDTHHPFPEKGHPKGLAVLFTTEMWERFNYYGMRAILVLFMTKALLFDQVFASNLYGSYISLVWLSSLVGGYIADRFWGNKRSIIAGGLIMAFGEFILFICASLYNTSEQLSLLLFVSGLGFVIAGNGLFKPNISTLVGQLYPKGDRRIDSAYTIFYMGINTGGMLGPFICGLVGDTGNPADFKWSFLAAGIGMLLSVIIQKIYQNKYLVAPNGKPIGGVPKDSPKMVFNPLFVGLGLALICILMIGVLYLDAMVFNFLSYILPGSVLLIAFIVFFDKSLTRLEKERVGVIFIVSFFVIFFWSAFEQAGASLTFFADSQTQRDLGFFTIPASVFQSLNSAFVVLFAPLFAWLWIVLKKYEPSSPLKMALGLFFLSMGYLWIAFGVKDVQPGIKVSVIWLTGMYALHTWGELCVSPIGLALVNKLAPVKFGSLLMAVWFLSNAAGNKLAGVLSTLYPDQGRTTSFLGYEMNNMYDFFMLFVFMSGVAAVVLFFLSRKLTRVMQDGK